MPQIILIIDDEPTLAQLTARSLEAEGYLALAMRSPIAALELLRGTTRCDLLVVDVRMPEMSGFDVALWAREHRPNLPVLFMSGFVDADYAGAGGFHDFLAKPFKLTELVTAVQRVLAASESVTRETLESDPAPTAPAPPGAVVQPS